MRHLTKREVTKGTKELQQILLLLVRKGRVL